MTTRVAGRHRSTKSLNPPSPPSLLLLDYLETGLLPRVPARPAGRQFSSRPAHAPGPPPGLLPRVLARPAGRQFSSRPAHAPGPPPGRRLGRVPGWPPGRRLGRVPGPARGCPRFTGRRATVRQGSLFRPPVDWRMLTMAVPAVLAGVAVAVILGYALLRSSATSGGRNAVPALVLPPQAVQPPAVISVRPATLKPGRPHHFRRKAAPHRSAAARPVPGTAPAALPAPVVSPVVAQARPPAIVVRYLVASQGPGGFQGEIQVTNNGSQPIADWQIVVALPNDQVTSFSNANGFFSNGILLLQPGPGTQPIAAGGGTLNVFFVAEGQQTIPEACAFNETPCS